jgi:CRP-like cAMP-binding protein
LDIFGESALFTEANGLSKRRATVSTVDQSVQLLALSQMKFNNLLASGALNEECVNKLIN